MSTFNLETFRVKATEDVAFASRDMTAVENAFNFGVLEPIQDNTQTLTQLAPGLTGRWDGKTEICNFDLQRKLFNGKVLPCHNQGSNGICGGAAGAGNIEAVQVNMMTAGTLGKFHHVSASWLYWAAREMYGMNGVRAGDGVAAGSIPEAGKRFGVTHIEEAGEPAPDGDSETFSDMAASWGRTKVSRDTITKLTNLAGDNIIQDQARITSAAMAADALASGGSLVHSAVMGFKMTRDSDGFAAWDPRNNWSHYMGTNGLLLPRGKPQFTVVQSWGTNTPTGPQIQSGRCPGYCFGITWDEMERLCTRFEVHAIFSFPLWDAERAPETKINWKNYF